MVKVPFVCTLLLLCVGASYGIHTPLTRKDDRPIEMLNIKDEVTMGSPDLIQLPVVHRRLDEQGNADENEIAAEDEGGDGEVGGNDDAAAAGDAEEAAEAKEADPDGNQGVKLDLSKMGHLRMEKLTNQRIVNEGGTFGNMGLAAVFVVFAAVIVVFMMYGRKKSPTKTN